MYSLIDLYIKFASSTAAVNWILKKVQDVPVLSVFFFVGQLFERMQN